MADQLPQPHLQPAQQLLQVPAPVSALALARRLELSRNRSGLGDDNASTRALFSDAEAYASDSDLDVDSLESAARSTVGTSLDLVSMPGSASVYSLQSGPRADATASGAAAATTAAAAAAAAATGALNVPDNASVMTIASSSRDWRRRPSIDTNVSVAGIAPRSLFNVER